MIREEELVGTFLLKKSQDITTKDAKRKFRKNFGKKFGKNMGGYKIFKTKASFLGKGH